MIACMITFQELVLRLTNYWKNQGCTLHFGHDSEVGAATFNPATFLRCLGPEPYKTAYTEPCRRPSDGRYAQNPNRVHLFHQFQVLIKPSPENIQELYIDSLRAIGLNLEEHDIRFVHDDWENPTIGAWGLGWEVWLNGMEVTQYTYFQAVGSIELPVMSIELAYGLERIAMYLQGVDSILDVQWDETLTLGDLSKQSEIEWSRYNFEYADTTFWKNSFDAEEKEAKRLVEIGLCIPAFDRVMKASHAFNTLGARGAISTTERTGYITRVRDLARLVASGYELSRKELGFPLLKKFPQATLAPLEKLTAPKPEKEKDLFLLEIGVEELPATFVPIGIAQLKSALTALLKEEGISYSVIETYGTPRRLVATISDLASKKAAQKIEKKGPAVNLAFTETGSITPAAIGFLKSAGIQPEKITKKALEEGSIPSLSIKAFGETNHLFTETQLEEKSTLEILQNKLGSLIASLEFPKKMHWDQSGVLFPRPVRHLLCLYGETSIPFYFGKIKADRITFGHRQRTKRAALTVSSSHDFFPLLRKNFVEVDQNIRAESIKKQLKAIEEKKGLKALLVDKVLKEVLYLSEWPELILASFSATFLECPKEVLVSEMVEHQRYFPLEDKEGLSPYFIITADNTPTTLIEKGNERVLSARLSDGAFLYKQDRGTNLSHFNEKLKTMTFQKELGSVYNKVERLQKGCQIIQKHLKKGDIKVLESASLYAKADLASLLVGEFPELQGIAGSYYAKEQGLGTLVASAMKEHWMPIAESAPLPQTVEGAILSLTDKLDNLVGYFSVGLIPSSSSDPYALRRAVIGMLRIELQFGFDLDFKELLSSFADLFSHIKDKKELVDAIMLFILARAKKLFEQEGFLAEEINSAFAIPRSFFKHLEILKEYKSFKEKSTLQESYKRLIGQRNKNPKNSVNSSLLVEESEKKLFKALAKTAISFNDLLLLCPLIMDLFNSVKIQAEDLAIRENRLALIEMAIGQFDALLDFSVLKNS